MSSWPSICPWRPTRRPWRTPAADGRAVRLSDLVLERRDVRRARVLVASTTGVRRHRRPVPTRGGGLCECAVSVSDGSDERGQLRAQDTLRAGSATLERRPETRARSEGVPRCSLDSALRTTARALRSCGRNSTNGCTSASRIASSTASSLPPANNGRRMNSSAAMTPSRRGRRAGRRGARDLLRRQVAELAVRARDRVRLECVDVGTRDPKSAIFTSPWIEISTFDGLMSDARSERAAAASVAVCTASRPLKI